MKVTTPQEWTPRYMFFTKGVGRHKERLASFEEALRKAKIAHFNLVHVSSIFPPFCKVIPASHGLTLLTPGQVVFCVMARQDTNENERLIASSIGLAIPKDPNHFGYLSEHHSFGENEKTAGDYAEDLAASMLATILGVEFDVDASWDKKKEIYRISNKIVRSMNITQSAIGKKDVWTTTIAAAVLVL
ncbi:MAG: arginine decarboxylase, pyruvoyl-dependent [Planctomycetes bacterium]|nr:arginine decarboxylase, pyruvoyl-dependent [Planctomycetota bacterium]